MDTVFTFAGGIGLFLLGMTLMTDGLKLSAGAALGDLLNKATSTRLKGLATGFFITTLVQSSTAVTVAIIGFINAGILTFKQALWVIFGTNVGTTMTGWIVALIGFKLNIEAFALPMIALGVLLYLTGNQSRRGALGHAIAGFGILFLGLDFLQNAFAGIADQITIPSGDGPQAFFLQLLLGLGLTIVIQSSSAALVITLAAAQSGLIGLHGAAAIVIGLNIGTTVTALIAAINATSNGKRAALAHTLFNIISAVAVLILLPVLLPALLYLQQLWFNDSQLATTLAFFHTSFSVIGVILMFPLANYMAKWLNRCFVKREDNLSKPRYLDNNITTISSLAIPAAEREILRLGGIVTDATLRILQTAPGDTHERMTADRLRTEAEARHLSQHITDFLIRINRQTMHDAESADMATLLQQKRCYDTMLILLPNLHEFDPEQTQEPDFLANACTLLQQLHPNQATETVSAELALGFSAQYASCRQATLSAAANGTISVYTMELKLNQLSAIHKAVLKAHEAVNLRYSLSRTPEQNVDINAQTSN